MRDFLECNELITLIKFDKTAQTYTCYALRGSWYLHRGKQIEDSGAREASSCRIRIPDYPYPALPVAGDYVVRGALRSVSKLSDLDAYEHYRITDVADNRRGRLPHVAVSAS